MMVSQLMRLTFQAYFCPCRKFMYDQQHKQTDPFKMSEPPHLVQDPETTGASSEGGEPAV